MKTKLRFKKYSLIYYNISEKNNQLVFIRSLNKKENLYLFKYEDTIRPDYFVEPDNNIRLLTDIFT